MLSLPQPLINTYIERLQAGYRSVYGNHRPHYSELLGRVAKEAIAKISRSDAPYHDVEHTLLVALAGQEILQGKHRREGGVTAEDWLHGIISLLLHDIGYIKGASPLDLPEWRVYATGLGNETVILPETATDASLTPYHVDRGQQFVRYYFADTPAIDPEVIAHNIELTRFPVPKDELHADTASYAGLARAADLIGQLADPRYLQKLPALYQEFAETGANVCLGYNNPQDLRAGYPNFFWNVVYPYIEDGLRYLEMTQGGKQIVANLYANVFVVESELRGVARQSVPAQTAALESGRDRAAQMTPELVRV